MLILRFFLYMICFFCMTWSFVIFGGPILLRGFINSYTDGVVTISDIRISPKLDVSIGRIELASKNNESKTHLRGFSRSTEISWSLKSGQSFLIIDFGPTVIKDLVVAERLLLQTPPFKELDWGNLILAGRADKLDFKSFGVVDDLVLEGDFNYEFLKVSDLYFELNKVEALYSGQQLSIGAVSLELDEVKLDDVPSSQNFKGKFSAVDISDDRSHFSISNMTGTIDVLGEIKNLKAELQNVRLPNILDLSSLSEVLIEINKIDDNKYGVSVDGNSNDFELYFASSFIGSIPPSSFKIDLELDTLKSQVTANSTINLDNLHPPAISGEASAKFLLNSIGGLLQCNIENCNLSGVDLNYQLDFGQEWVKGRSFCSGSPCTLRTMDNSVTTSGTSDVFTAINRAGILNPLYSLYLYSLVGSGQKIGRGHQLKF